MAKIQVYCDGGCRGNGSINNVGGWGFLLQYRQHRLERYGGAVNTTNNKMELLACVKALEAIKNKDCTVEVISDSQYLVKGINEWIDGWIKNNWRNSSRQPVKNKELWQELLSLREKFREIKFIHCKGHSGNKGNERADALTNMAMDEVEESLTEDGVLESV